MLKPREVEARIVPATIVSAAVRVLRLPCCVRPTVLVRAAMLCSALASQCHFALWRWLTCSSLCICALIILVMCIISVIMIVVGAVVACGLWCGSGRVKLPGEHGLLSCQRHFAEDLELELPHVGAECAAEHLHDLLRARAAAALLAGL